MMDKELSDQISGQHDGVCCELVSLISYNSNFFSKHPKFPLNKSEVGKVGEGFRTEIKGMYRI